MASGHVNRTQRPNTWLHRPTLRREDSPCQLGAVHTWPLSTFAAPHQFGSDQRYSGSGGTALQRSIVTGHQVWERGSKAEFVQKLARLSNLPACGPVAPQSRLVENEAEMQRANSGTPGIAVGCDSQ